MPTLSGIYTSFTGQTLAIDEHGHLSIIQNDKQKTILRADAEFWLCEDDGVSTLLKIGKFGTPKKVTLHFQDKDYHIWVEPRGFSDGAYEACKANLSCILYFMESLFPVEIECTADWG
ncbi:hypothetical protein ABOM_001532 [Aspergillus bombycis]|uniref:Uncharacterized protein n=1 Tax=Aspergillus bombycis TaxID=109264 RepID=A0A1F8ADN4_9EURO|nr:hypothetical protein ABOM_001532 [Aspergillus bombycis]OGM49792.1 hypothetical protein ABOM_001532 [Aspergillus bombycis]